MKINSHQQHNVYLHAEYEEDSETSMSFEANIDKNEDFVDDLTMGNINIWGVNKGQVEAMIKFLQRVKREL